MVTHMVIDQTAHERQGAPYRLALMTGAEPLLRYCRRLLDDISTVRTRILHLKLALGVAALLAGEAAFARPSCRFEDLHEARRITRLNVPSQGSTHGHRELGVDRLHRSRPCATHRTIVSTSTPRQGSSTVGRSWRHRNLDEIVDDTKVPDHHHHGHREPCRRGEHDVYLTKRSRCRPEEDADRRR